MKLLITGAWPASEEQIFAICEMGHTVIMMSDERGGLPCDANDVEGIICNGLFLYHPIESFKKLRYIQLTSAGFDRVNMDYIRSRGIVIQNARGVYSIPMAEYALSSVLRIYKHMEQFSVSQANCTWKKDRSLMELFGKCVCIIGCGNVGTECAKRFFAMGCRVIGVDSMPRRDENYSSMVLPAVLTEVLPRADVVILTLPLTVESYHLFQRKELELLKANCVLVNIARGGVIDTEALIRVLAARSDINAVLDVFEEEPLPEDSVLWSLPNVYLTPHNSFVGDGNTIRLAAVIMENLQNLQDI